MIRTRLANWIWAYLHRSASTLLIHIAWNEYWNRRAIERSFRRLK